MAFPKFTHDPQAVLDYPVDWSAWLVEGDTLLDVTVTAEAGITVDSVQPPVDGVAVAWISAADATVGETYTVTYHAVTANGLEDDRSILLKIQER